MKTRGQHPPGTGIVLALALLGVLAASGTGAPADAALTVAQEAALRARIRATLFVPEPLPPLGAEVHGRFEPVPGVIAERVTYASQLGLRVPAIVYSPIFKLQSPISPQARRPGLVVVNGHGGDKYSWYAFYAGVLYARAGAVVVTFDPVGEGERNAERKSGTRAHDRLHEPREMGQRMGGLLVTDVMQAVSYLASRPDVDPDRIGAMGYSLGSFVLGITGAAEPRLKACVLVGGGNLDERNGYWDGSKPMCQAIPYQSLGFLGDRAAILYALHAARGRTLVYNGLADTVVAIPRHGEPFFKDLQARTRQVARQPERVFETGFEAGISHRPFFVTAPVAAWLERELDFPAWREAEVRAMPTTHVGTWAREKGVAMDRLYATEDREGGTPALGTGVPGLTREQLSVFSPQEWERRKESLVYERWVEEARKRLGQDAPRRHGDTEKGNG